MLHQFEFFVSEFSRFFISEFLRQPANQHANWPIEQSLLIISCVFFNVLIFSKCRQQTPHPKAAKDGSSRWMTMQKKKRWPFRSSQVNLWTAHGCQISVNVNESAWAHHLSETGRSATAVLSKHPFKMCLRARWFEICTPPSMVERTCFLLERCKQTPPCSQTVSWGTPMNLHAISLLVVFLHHLRNWRTMWIDNVWLSFSQLHSCQNSFNPHKNLWDLCCGGLVFVINCQLATRQPFVPIHSS